MFDTFDTGITVYQQRYDADARLTRWTKRHVNNASWYYGNNVRFANGGPVSADVYKIRIRAVDFPDGLTLQTGDIIVKGLINIDILDASDITGKYTSFTVSRIYDNRRGVPAMRHIRIEGE